jgi:hypothetical protein
MKSLFAIALFCSCCASAQIAIWSTVGVENGFVGNPVWSCTEASEGIDQAKTVLKLDETKLSKSYFAGKSFTYRHLNEEELNPECYIQLVIAPAEGRKLDLTILELNVYSTAAGPQQLAVRTGVDDFYATIQTQELLRGSHNLVTVDLEALGLKNINEPIEFRIYMWGAQGMQTANLTDSRTFPAVRVFGSVR